MKNFYFLEIIFLLMTYFCNNRTFQSVVDHPICDKQSLAALTSFCFREDSLKADSLKADSLKVDSLKVDREVIRKQLESIMINPSPDSHKIKETLNLLFSCEQDHSYYYNLIGLMDKSNLEMILRVYDILIKSGLKPTISESNLQEYNLIEMMIYYFFTNLFNCPQEERCDEEEFATLFQEILSIGKKNKSPFYKKLVDCLRKSEDHSNPLNAYFYCLGGFANVDKFEILFDTLAPYLDTDNIECSLLLFAIDNEGYMEKDLKKIMEILKKKSIQPTIESFLFYLQLLLNTGLPSDLEQKNLYETREKKIRSLVKMFSGYISNFDQVFPVKFFDLLCKECLLNAVLDEEEAEEVMIKIIRMMKDLDIQLNQREFIENLFKHFKNIETEESTEIETETEESKKNCFPESISNFMESRLFKELNDWKEPGLIERFYLNTCESIEADSGCFLSEIKKLNADKNNLKVIESSNNILNLFVDEKNKQNYVLSVSTFSLLENLKKYYNNISTTYSSIFKINNINDNLNTYQIQGVFYRFIFFFINKYYKFKIKKKYIKINQVIKEIPAHHLKRGSFTDFKSDNHSLDKILNGLEKSEYYLKDILKTYENYEKILRKYS